jgi:hypothetical protein
MIKKQYDLKLRPPKYSKQEGVEEIEDEVFQSHFCTLVVGKPGSGKSHLITELVSNPSMYANKFDHIWVLSPYPFEALKLVEGLNYRFGLDLEWIYANIKKLNESPPRPYKINVLLIFDDVISDIKKQQYNPALTSLLFNRRHLLRDGTISILITSQKYIVCPPRVRSTLTSVIFFGVSKPDFKKIKEENFTSSQGKMTDLIVEEVFRENPHNFIYWRNDTGCIYKNFEYLISS